VWLLVEHPERPDDQVAEVERPAFGQPGHMAGYVNTAQDTGGIHVNSGIPNKAAYLMAARTRGGGYDQARPVMPDSSRRRIVSNRRTKARR
jgi:Zn-dependent metalloprotease